MEKYDHDTIMKHSLWFYINKKTGYKFVWIIIKKNKLNESRKWQWGEQRKKL